MNKKDNLYLISVADDLICSEKAGLPMSFSHTSSIYRPLCLLCSLSPFSLGYDLHWRSTCRKPCLILSAEMPAWQQNGVIGPTGGISLSLSSLRGFPLWWAGWKVRFNVLWRVAAKEKLKALHAGFWVGHSSPCREWDVPEEFAID